MRPREPTHPGLPHPVLGGATQARRRFTLPQALSAGADGAPRASLRSVPLPESTARLAAVLACLPSARRPRGARPPACAHRLPGFPPPGSPLSPPGRRGRRRAPDAPLGFGFLLRGLPPPRDKPLDPKARDFSSRGLPAPHPKASYPVLQSLDRRGEWSRGDPRHPFRGFRAGPPAAERRRRRRARVCLDPRRTHPRPRGSYRQVVPHQRLGSDGCEAVCAKGFGRVRSASP
jgi:hypothetical protein